MDALMDWAVDELVDGWKGQKVDGLIKQASIHIGIIGEKYIETWMGLWCLTYFSA